MTLGTIACDSVQEKRTKPLHIIRSLHHPQNCANITTNFGDEIARVRESAVMVNRDDHHSSVITFYLVHMKSRHI